MSCWSYYIVKKYFTLFFSCSSLSMFHNVAVLLDYQSSYNEEIGPSCAIKT